MENKDGGAGQPAMTPTEALNVLIGELGVSLTKEAIANSQGPAGASGAIDMMAVVVKLEMATENVQLLTGLVMDLAKKVGMDPAYTDDYITTLMAARIRDNIRERDAVTGKKSMVQVVRGVDPRQLRQVNGSGGPRR